MDDLKGVQQKILDWFTANGRDLPWRQLRDPWKILVAEVMSQQTQVDRVVPKWTSFLQLFPTPEACAEASQASIVAQWSGLGFNRRARNLHQTAQRITTQHGGMVPSERKLLLALPGIGEYTARAVRVFAFELDDAVLDTNVGRILARVYNSSLSPTVAQQKALDLVPAGSSWEWNQAILDIGTLHCKAKSPICETCPFRNVCVWYEQRQKEGVAALDPALRSAGVSTPQSTFEGSDRQGRGKLLKALAAEVEVTDETLASVMGWPQAPQRAADVAAKVVADQLVSHEDGIYRLA